MHTTAEEQAALDGWDDHMWLLMLNIFKIKMLMEAMVNETLNIGAS